MPPGPVELKAQAEYPHFMFLIGEVVDRVKVSILPRDREEETRSALAKKYIGKVVEGTGVALRLLGVLKIHEYKIVEDFLIAKVTFQMLFFKLLRQEIVCGTIVAQDGNGIVVRTPFHSNITVPACSLPSNCEMAWKDRSMTWVWTYKGNKLPFRTGDVVRARIENEEQTSIVASFSEMGLGPLSWWT
jgi:DNA-directed RNA polymerase III subunit RPC8